MLNELLKRYPCLADIEKDITAARDSIIECYERGGKLLLCGNGGSCADCEHITGELMKGFLKKRALSDSKKQEMKANSPELSDEILSSLQGALPAVSLSSMAALNTAFCNDVAPTLVYAQAVMGLGKKGDLLIAVSTSGNSENVYSAALVARALGVEVIALTGATGGKLREASDICVCVPETETFKIQELHLPVYHYLCAETEAHFFPDIN